MNLGGSHVLFVCGTSFNIFCPELRNFAVFLSAICTLSLCIYYWHFCILGFTICVWKGIISSILFLITSYFYVLVEFNFTWHDLFILWGCHFKFLQISKWHYGDVKLFFWNLTFFIVLTITAEKLAVYRKHLKKVILWENENYSACEGFHLMISYDLTQQ